MKALVRATVSWDESSSNDGRSWNTHKLELLECPPFPFAIKGVLQVPELWKTLEPYIGEVDEETKGNNESSPALAEDYASANHAMVRRIILRLERRERTLPRIRPPYIGFKLLKALEELEQQVDLVDVRSSKPGDEYRSTSSEEQLKDKTAAPTRWNLPQTGHDRILISNHYKLTRQEYLQSKKHPHVAWFLQRILSFPSAQSLRHVVVDVGGGRGDLAIALAIGLGEKTRVTVVDMNESSLEAGRAFAEQCGVGEQMNWICQDFTAFAAGKYVEDDVDMVVALHACGNFTDHALDFAVRQRGSFLICPCCYSKMKH